MRRVLGLVLCLSIVFVSSAFADFKITRVFEDGGRASAMVMYENTTKTTFKNVTIKCYDLNNKGDVVGVNTRSFFGHTVGPIYPGFSDSVKVPVDVHGASWSSVSCKAIQQ